MPGIVGIRDSALPDRYLHGVQDGQTNICVHVAIPGRHFPYLFRHSDLIENIMAIPVVAHHIPRSDLIAFGSKVIFMQP